MANKGWANYEKYENKLWSDLKSDTERAEFLRSGRAWEIAIIDFAIIEDVAEAFEFRAKCQKIITVNL